nr:MAG TPA: hypothetical protein [Caudoviricetes sp.]
MSTASTPACTSPVMRSTSASVPASRRWASTTASA